MKKNWLPIFLLLWAGAMPVVCSASMTNAATARDVLTMQAGRFYLGGQPFAEISFNKFDLFWSVWQGLQDSRKQGQADAWDRALAKQDIVLHELHSLGCRTIRIFGAPYKEFGNSWESDPAWRADFFQAMDMTLDLCNRHDIKVIYSLGAAHLYDSATIRKSRKGGESQYELIVNPAAL